MTQDQPNRLDRIEATQAVHSQILNELALAHRELAEFSTRQAERQQQTSDRHDEVLIRVEGAIADLTTQMNQLGSRVDALTTSTTETIQLVAQQAVQAERDRAEIRRIWEYLERQTGNGNGRGEQ